MTSLSLTDARELVERAATEFPSAGRWADETCAQVLAILSRGDAAQWAVGDALADAGFGESCEEAADLAGPALNTLQNLRLIRFDFVTAVYTRL